MPTATFTLLINMIGLLVFGVLSIWLWGGITFKGNTQTQLEATFARSKKRFRILFPLGAIACAYGIIKAFWL